MDYFDLHCDTACHWADHGQLLENGYCHVNLKKAASLGGRYGQVFALFIDDRYSGKTAYRRYLALRDGLHRQLSGNRQIALCRDAEGMEKAWGAGQAAAVLSVENGSVLGGKLDMLLQLQSDGVKLLTLTWFGENELGFGSQIGGALKPFGLQVLDALPQYGILPDISHLSDEGVAQVFERYQGPVVASHSGARRACGHYRNLTDSQIRQIVASDGLIGVNFFSRFLNDEPSMAGFDDIRRHLEVFWENGAQNHLAFGSDFDGAEMPPCLHGGLADVPALWEYLCRHNYPQELLKKLFFENARRFFAGHL